MQEGVQLKQKNMPMWFFAVSLMMANTVQWTLVDMYLPALPVLKEYFNVSESVMNLSMTTCMLTTAIGTLISGTISDKYGRKALFFLGFLISGGSNFACAISTNIWMLCIMRGLSGLGSGFMISIITAMIKDSFSGELFQKVMTIAQSVSVIGPIVAPSVGSILINYFSWRGIFVFLGAATFVTMIPFLFTQETCPKEKRLTGSVGKVFMEGFFLFKKPSFSLLMMLLVMVTIPIWAFIGTSSYMFIEGFGLSNMEYSFYYAISACVSFVAPFIFILLAKFMPNRQIIRFMILLLGLNTILCYLIVDRNPVCCLIVAAGWLVVEGVMRPLGSIILLEDNPDQTGSASSMFHFSMNLVGIVGTSLATLPWSSIFFGLLIISILCTVGSILCWAPLIRRKMIQGL